MLAFMRHAVLPFHLRHSDFSLIYFCDHVNCVQVYLAAGAVYGLEGALSDLEDCARSISSSTTETELAFLEDQVATAAAQVQQSELQVCACM